MTPPTVLVVDDERAVREVVATALTRAGFHVTAAADAEDALRQLEHAAPVDLLITDVMLPRMNGPDLAREVRRRSPGTRVLFISGYTGETSLDPEDLHGGRGFLQKPFGTTTVLARVRELLDLPDA